MITKKGKYYEKNKRSVVKAMTYRVLIVAANALVIYLLTGDKVLTFNLSIISIFVGTVIYYFHERVWNKIHWGRIKK